MHHLKNTPSSESLTEEEGAVLKQLARLSDGGEMRWDHPSPDACVKAPIAACAEPTRYRSGIDGEATVDLMAETVLSACRAGVPHACYLVADWLREAALDALRA